MEPRQKSMPCTARDDGRGWVEWTVKTVGRRRPLDPAAALRWNAAMLTLSPLCGRWFKRGVYKFKTWEEERAWTSIQISQAMQRRK